MSTENTNPVVEENLFDLSMFGTTASEIAETLQEDEYESKNFTPYLELNPQGRADNKDSCYVKLIKNPDAKAKNILSKVSYKIVTECSNRNFMFDSLKSFGWNDNTCIVADLWKDCKGNKVDEERFRKHFQFKKPRVVLVQVIKFDSRPELEGQIMPLRIVEEVEDLIKKTIEPTKEEIEEDGVVANNVYDIFEGQALRLVAGVKQIPKPDGSTVTGRDFKDSKFTKSVGYMVFFAPKEDAEGNYITKKITIGEKEQEVYDYEKIELTAEERTAYAQKNFQGVPSLLAKLQRVLKYLGHEDTPKHADYGYNEPSEDKVKNVTLLVNKFKAGEPMTISGDVATDEGAEGAEGSESGDTQAGETTGETVNETELDSIVEQAMDAQ
ncbi:hypothetical protein BPT24_110 [Tenacibaculum phage pT24]|uniref:Single-stranded DNA-binding protein n=1 Tax=Tenacibaculum phage pT24 TaxID=1880590 RepID=A0A1B4XWR7_9CAUD|nr:hypothetical protein HYP10_gp110 [Tenacibaculum phage pT24]BAV39235.1 hypothetical protein BPT24_110 [Tenacibaculum phage pT24]